MMAEQKIQEAKVRRSWIHFKPSAQFSYVEVFKLFVEYFNRLNYLISLLNSINLKFEYDAFIHFYRPLLLQYYGCQQLGTFSVCTFSRVVTRHHCRIDDLSLLCGHARSDGPHECRIWQRPGQLVGERTCGSVQQPIQQLLECFGHQPSVFACLPRPR